MGFLGFLDFLVYLEKFFWSISNFPKLIFQHSCECSGNKKEATRFFSFQPQCCLTFSWIELQMLFGYCLKPSLYWDNFIFSIFGSMFRPRSIYVAILWSIFHFQPHFHCHYLYNLIKTNALAFCTCLDDNVDEEIE